MSLVVVADPDLRERMRCIRIVADQTPASALGAANWPELTQVLDDVRDVGLVLYTHSLAGAPSAWCWRSIAATSHHCPTASRAWRDRSLKSSW